MTRLLSTCVGSGGMCIGADQDNVDRFDDVRWSRNILAMMPAPPKEWVLITLADLRGRPEHASQALSHAWVEWQEHPPGEEVALDFSSGNELEVTIGGEPFVTRGRGWQRDPIR